MTFPKEAESLEKIVVTRHKNLVQYLLQIKLVDESVPVKSHVNITDIEGKHVIGILPYSLACHAAVYTEIPLRIPFEKRTKVLTLDELMFYMQEPKTYQVKELKDE